MNNKIIVTGSNGQLGQELQVLAASYPGYEFTFLDRQQLAIDNPEAVMALFSNIHPAYCINCAAYTAVDKAETEPEAAFLINGDAVGTLSAACAAIGARLIHISTDYVFNGEGQTPYSEDDLTDPVNLYGASKLRGEELAMQHPDTSIVIRTSWVYSRFGNNFVKTMMRLLRERESIHVVDDQVGAPTYAADLAESIMHIISSGKWVAGLYHFSNEGVISWFQFAEEISAIIKSSCVVNPIPSSAYPTPAKRPHYSVMDKSKIKNVYNIELKDWKDSLSACVNQLMS